MQLKKDGQEYFIPLYKRGFWNERIEIVARIERLQLVWLNTSIPDDLKKRFPNYWKASNYNDDKYNRPEITYYDGIRDNGKLSVIQQTKESYSTLTNTKILSNTLCERILSFLKSVMAIDRELDIMFELLYLKGYRFYSKTTSDSYSTTRMIVLGLRIAKLVMGQFDGDSDSGNVSIPDGLDYSVLTPTYVSQIPLDNMFLGSDIGFGTIIGFNNNSSIDPLIGYSSDNTDLAISFTGSTDLEFAKSYKNEAQRYADEAERHLRNMEEAASSGDSSQYSLEKQWANEATERAKMFDGFAKRREEWSKIGST